jgi:hypothetical protein
LNRRGPILARYQDLDTVAARTFQKISSVLPIDEVREGQREEIKGSWFRRKPPGLGLAFLSPEFAAFSFALTSLTEGLNDKGIVGIYELLICRGQGFYGQNFLSFREVVILVWKNVVLLQ